MNGLKKYLLILFFLCFKLISSGQITHTVLWQVSGKELTTSSFLMGTSHVESFDSFISRYPVIDSVLNVIDLLIVENVAKKGEGGIDPEILCYGGDTTIIDVLSKSECLYLKDYINRKSGNNPEVFDNLVKMRPQLLVMAIEMLEAGAGEQEADNIQGLEQGLMQAAAQKHKTLKGLEDVHERSLALLEDRSDNDAIQEIMRITQSKSEKLIQPNAQKQSAGQNVKALQLNPDRYDSLQISYYFDQTADEVHGAAFVRNQAWMKKIPAFLSAHSTLIAVGLDHLKTKAGLVQQLRKLGYRVEPVPMRSGN